MSLQSGQIIGQDLSPNANISGFQIADKTLQLRNFADGVLPTSILQNGTDIFVIQTKPSVAFNFTSGASANSTTATITHNLGYVPIVFPEVKITNNQISAGQVGTFALPYLLMGGGGGTTNVFIVLAFIKVLSVSTSTIVFEIGAQGPSQNIAGTITAYILKETST